MAKHETGNAREAPQFDYPLCMMLEIGLSEGISIAVSHNSVTTLGNDRTSRTISSGLGSRRPRLKEPIIGRFYNRSPCLSSRTRSPTSVKANVMIRGTRLASCVAVPGQPMDGVN